MSKDLPIDWSEAQNSLFIKMYRFMSMNHDSFVHPEAQAVVQEYWETTCHNAAYAAAELLETDNLRILDISTDQVVADSSAVVIH